MTNLISEVKAALQAATPGKWEVVNLGQIEIATNYRVENGMHVANWIAEMDVQDEEEEEQAFSDAHLIANAPTWLQQLTDRLETAERQRDEAVKVLEEMVDEMGYLKSQFNTGDVAGLGMFSDADALVKWAGEIIIDIRGYERIKGDL